MCYEKEVWTEEETAFLKENVGKGLTFADLGKKLGRSESAVRNRVCKLKLHNAVAGQAHRAWSEEDFNYLRENYGKMKAREIAEKLERSTASIHVYSKKLGLVPEKPRKAKKRVWHEGDWQEFVDGARRKYHLNKKEYDRKARRGK